VPGNPGANPSCVIFDEVLAQLDGTLWTPTAQCRPASSTISCHRET